VIILIVGAIVTPSADPFSQALIAMPLYLLYEISILISSGVVRRKAAEEAAEKLKEQSSS
jgi:sec-independent protein translocase protein TatC